MLLSISSGSTVKPLRSDKMITSDCCNEPIKIVGCSIPDCDHRSCGSTLYAICTECGQPCNPVTMIKFPECGYVVIKIDQKRIGERFRFNKMIRNGKYVTLFNDHFHEPFLCTIPWSVLPTEYQDLFTIAL